MTNNNRWNPKDFLPVAHKSEDDGQLLIFTEEVDEPPDPDDYSFPELYRAAYLQWKYRTSITGGAIENNGEKTSITGGAIEVHGCMGEYSKGKNWYYRYSYRVGNRRTKHKHIGPCGNPLAETKAKEVREMIALGESVAKILSFLESSGRNTLRS